MSTDVTPILTHAERVRQVRQHMGWSQVDLAQALGVTRNYVSYVETGRRSLSEPAMNLLCTLSGVSKAWLRDGVGKQWEKPPEEESTFDTIKRARPDMPDSFAAHVAEALDKLDADDWMFLAKLAQDMAEKAKEAQKTAPDESGADDDEIVYSETVAKNAQRTPFAVRRSRSAELLQEAAKRVTKDDSELD